MTMLMMLVVVVMTIQHMFVFCVSFSMFVLEMDLDLFSSKVFERGKVGGKVGSKNQQRQSILFYSTLFYSMLTSGSYPLLK